MDEKDEEDDDDNDEEGLNRRGGKSRTNKEGASGNKPRNESTLKTAMDAQALQPQSRSQMRSVIPTRGPAADLQPRMSSSPDLSDYSLDGRKRGGLSTHASHSARPSRPHHPKPGANHGHKLPGGSRSSSLHGRKHSFPGTTPATPFLGIPPPPHAYYPQPSQPFGTTGTGDGYGPHDGGYYGAMGWHAGLPAPMPMYGPWMNGYELGWGQQQPHRYGYGSMANGMPPCGRSDAPTRVVMVSGVNLCLEEEDLLAIAANFGTVRAVDWTQVEVSGRALVAYFDLRHAQAAMKGLADALTAWGGGYECGGCGVEFVVPPFGMPTMENQGVLAAWGGAEEMSGSEARAVFGKFGEVKATWKTGGGRYGRSEHRFVEYYDTRCAEEAMAELKSVFRGQIEYAPFASAGDRHHHNHQQEQQHHSFHHKQQHGGHRQQRQRQVANVSYSMYLGGNGCINPEDGCGGEQGGMHGMWGMGVQTPGAYGWGPYGIQHGGGYVEMQEQGRSQGGTRSGGGGLEGVDVMGEQLGRYMAPQTCRGDYYSGQYMNYPPGSVQPLPLYGPGQAMPMMQPGGYDGVMCGLRPAEQLPKSPGHDSSASEPSGWRPQRSGRATVERGYDPGQYEFNLEEAQSKSPTARATLMIRNIPNKYSQKMLLDVLNRKYRGKYDFFYLPIDFKNRCNLGYAFVNFNDSKVTAEFYKEFHSKSWEEFNSKKVCEITYARVQGRDALIEHFRNSRFPCNEPDYLPLVFEPVEEDPQGNKSSTPVMKAMPVHHWTSVHYANNSAVAAH